MSKQGAVDTALGQLQVAANNEVVFSTLELLYEEGHRDGQLSVDRKLEESLQGLRKGNAALEEVKRQRDAILEEYARTSWTKVLMGMKAAGQHPPEFHLNVAYARQIGTKPCRRCQKSMILWDELPPQTRDEYMKKVWAAVMQVRAKRKLEADPPTPIADAPTTHELGGSARPTEPPCDHKNCDHEIKT